MIRGYTMDVICSTGFGIEVDSQRQPENPFIKYAKEFFEIDVGKNPIFLLACKCPFFCSSYYYLTSNSYTQSMTWIIYKRGVTTYHYENTPIQIYWKFYNQNRENFQIKILIFFIFLLKT